MAPGPPATLGRDRCLLCSKPCLQSVGEHSIRCWWCGTIFPAVWLCEALAQRKVTPTSL